VPVFQPDREEQTPDHPALCGLVDGWITSVGLDPLLDGPHSLRRTKVALTYRRTGNLRAVQLPLGRTRLESTVRDLGIEVDDALAISEQVTI